MALYQLDDFKSLLSSDNWDYFNRRRAFGTLDKLEWEDDYFLTVLCSLTENDFQKTVPNCKIEDYLFAEYVDADQYELHWDEESHVRTSLEGATVSLSLKIAIITNEHGRIAGIVTLHTSGT
jgi:hypothetical protein